MAQLPRPAAAASFAAEEDDDAFWAEALDIDDSDIAFDAPAPTPLLRPCATAAATASQFQPDVDKPPHPCHHDIPSPATAVQDATLFRSAAGSPIAQGRGDAQAPDADFLLPPWLCALQFLGKDRAWERPGISVIKKEKELHRAPLVAGVVTSCKPNGLGDLFLTIKDPSDSIGVSVHKKVLLEGNNGEDISIGCAILISKIAVFRPSRKACYLNCTKGKVVKVFRKDCATPSKQVISSCTTERSEGEDSTSNIMMKIFGRGMKVTEVSCERHGTPDSINSTSTWDIYSRCSLGSNQEGGLQLLAGDPRWKNISNSRADGSNAVPPDGNDETAKLGIDTENKHGSERNMNTELDFMSEKITSQRASISVPIEHPENELLAANECSVQPTKENVTTITGSQLNPKENVATITGSQLNPKRALSVASVAEWTDEQLSELFADY